MSYKVFRPGQRRKSISVDKGTPLGRGATGTVYRVELDGKALAAKIYHTDRVFHTKKIRAMLESPPDNCSVIHNGQEYPQIAWPIGIIEDDRGDEVGVLLPLVDNRESFSLDHYYDQVLFKKLNSLDEAALSYKLEIAKNLSKIVADLHRHKHYFIDCKPQNIRVFKRHHVVTLLDCDGFSINGKDTRFPAELLSTDYIAPEAQRLSSAPSALGEPQDQYALAVILFQILNRGTHPFQGIVTDLLVTANTNDEKAAAGLYPHGLTGNQRIKPRPQSTHHLWDTNTRKLFDRAFTADTPSTRPTAQDWADHFEQLLAKKTLVRCDRFPNDLEHIRFRGLDCPECYLTALPKFVPPLQNEIAETTRSPQLTSLSAGGQPMAMRQGSKDSWWNSWRGLAIIFLAGGLVLWGSINTQSEKHSASTSEAPAAYDCSVTWNGKQFVYGPPNNLSEHTAIRFPNTNDKVYFPSNMKVTQTFIINNLTTIRGWCPNINVSADKPIKAQLFDGTTLEFPAGTSEDVINKTAKKVTGEIIARNSPKKEIDYSKFSTEDLLALKENDLSRVSTEGLQILREQLQHTSQDPQHSKLLERVRSEQIGFSSVYVSDGRAAGWSASKRTQAEADNFAKNNCMKFAATLDSNTCRKLIAARGRCVAVARSDDGGFGAAIDDSMDRAFANALKACKSNGGGNCVIQNPDSRC